MTVHEPLAEPAPIVDCCPACRDLVAPGYLFCPHCGTDLRMTGDPSAIDAAGNVEVRRRIGGTHWSRPSEQPVEADDARRVLAPSDAPLTANRRRRRHSRRKFHRKPIFVLPVAALLLLTLAMSALAYRAESTISTLQTLSTPPPKVADNTVGADPVPSDVAIDSGPAKQALAAADADAPASDNGGIFGSVKDAAAGAGDLAEGAAVAAGVTDPSADAMTILVMGVDARPGAPIDVSVRPDALMVLRLNPGSGSCRALAIPRDTLVELPGYGQTKINHALMVGGIPYQKLVVERFLGVSVDRYALIDFTGFKELVDAVGGVPVTVPAALVANGQTLFAAGPQSFTGEQALAYARYRGGADVDVGRVRRQQQIIRGLLAVGGGRSAVKDVNDLLPALEDHIRTDLSAAELVALAEHYRTSCTENALRLDSLQGNFQPGNTPDPIFQRILTYNMVDPTTVQAKVAVLLGR